MNARVVAKFIKNSVKDMVENDNSSTYYIQLDDNFAICVGWCEGFDENDETCLHSKSEPNYCACVKVCEYNPWDMDYSYLCMPWYKDSEEVYDNELAIGPDEDYYDTAKWMLNCYRDMRKLLANGEITF